jgi:protein-S-isoprenylcysteine O-methyltransferase Ste14
MMRKLLPPAYFLCTISLAVILHFSLPGRQILTSHWRLVGLAPLVIGVTLNLLADRAFKKHDTTVKPFEESTALVTDGVFGITRNPMYLGMVLILFGVSMLLGSAAPFAVVLILAALLDRVFIAPEEQKLQDTFGEQFRQYRKRVRRWI